MGFNTKSWLFLTWMTWGTHILGNFNCFFSCCVSVVGNIAPEHPKTFVFKNNPNVCWSGGYFLH